MKGVVAGTGSGLGESEGRGVGVEWWMEGWYKGYMWLCLIMLQLDGGLHGGSGG